MEQSLPIIEARKMLTSLPEKFEKCEDGLAVKVTRRGKPVLAVLSWEFYESVIETLEILSDPQFMTKLKRGIREMKSGKGVPWESVKQKLGIE